MFRLWGKVFHHNRLLQDIVICNDENDTRTHKVMNALADICYAFDLEQPIWLEHNIKDFQMHAKTRFTADSFIESVAFDYLEIQIIEED